MNYWKRAGTSIRRKPGKSLILLVLVFILGSVIAGAVSIQQAVVNTEANLRRSVPPVAVISVDGRSFEAIYFETGTWPNYQITAEMLTHVSQLPYVQMYDFSISFGGLTSEGIVSYEPNPDRPQSFNEDMLNGIRGVSNPDILEVNQGALQMVAGRMFEPDEMTFSEGSIPIVVSQGFADVNHLSIGATLTGDIRIFPFSGGGGGPTESPDVEPIVEESFDFHIVGLFELGLEAMAPQSLAEESLQYTLLNRIYMPNAAVAELLRVQNEGWSLAFEAAGHEIGDNELSSHVENLFVLGDVGEVESFREAVASIIPFPFHIEDMSSTFQMVAASMETMLFIAHIVLAVAIWSTLVILSLLITLFLRDRKHEIGIYLAIGERKSKIIAQILMEVLSVSLIGITLSLFAGNVISDVISNQMLHNNLVAQMEQEDASFNWNPLSELGFSQTMTMEEMLESYEVGLDEHTIGIFYLVGTGTVVLSTIVPIIFVTSVKPKKILM